MQKLFRIGGFVATAIIIVGGIVTIFVGVDGRNDVRHELEREQITGTPDMTRDQTKLALSEAGLTETVELPDCDVADEPVDNGARARCFGSYMRVHALEATGGKPYSQMDRFTAADGGTTSNEEEAAKDPDSGKPVDNPARQIWVTETALAQALNMSYFAENVANFAIWMGVAMVLIGIGLLVMLIGLAPPPARSNENSAAV